MNPSNVIVYLVVILLIFVATTIVLIFRKPKISLFDSSKESRLRSPEFLLVAIMLFVLTILVALVLFAPAPINMDNLKGDNENFIEFQSELLGYRERILAILLTVFGAWVGAGAAYFFGRENLKEATRSLLAMSRLSPKEQLQKTLVRQIKLKPLSWVVNLKTSLGDIMKKLKEQKHFWFVPIVEEDGKLKTVILEEVVWQYVLSEIEKPVENPPPDPNEKKDPDGENEGNGEGSEVDPDGKPKSPAETKPENLGNAYQKTLKQNVGQLLKNMENNKDIKSAFIDKYITVTLDMSIGESYDLMQKNDVMLAIVLDAKNNPTHFFTTGDVRDILLRFE